MASKDWKAQLQKRQFHIDHLTKEIYKAISTSWRMVKKIEDLLQTYFLIGPDGQRIVNLLEEAKDQYEQVKNFFRCNTHKQCVKGKFMILMH